MSDLKAQKASQDSFSRTVRFKSEEMFEIEAFLKLNPILDFSTLTREAIRTFMKAPSIELRAIHETKGTTWKRT